MTFSEWCQSKQIKDNWKEALWNHLCAKYGLEKVEKLTEDDWANTWFELLAYVRKNLPY